MVCTLQITHRFNNISLTRSNRQCFVLGDSSELCSGEHNFKFQYNLPIGLPTSFEGNFGKIYYSATAVIDIPWKINETVEAKLEIWSPIDLNLKQHLKVFNLF